MQERTDFGELRGVESLLSSHTSQATAAYGFFPSYVPPLQGKFGRTDSIRLRGKGSKVFR